MNILTEFTEGLRIALESVRANKLRATLAVLGIVIGVFTVTLMATAITGLTTAFRNSIAAIGTDVIYLQRTEWGPSAQWWKMRARRPITLDVAKRFAERATMAQVVAVEAGWSGAVSFQDRSVRGVFIMGNVAASHFTRGLVIKEGRFLSEAEVDGGRPVCVLGFDLADKLFPNGGSLGQRVTTNGRRYEVIGVVDKMGQFAFGNLDNQLILPITRMVIDIQPEPDVTIAVKVGDPARIKEFEEELRGIMRAVRKVPLGEDDDFSINNQQALLDSFGQFTAITGSAGLFITGLALFVGGIGIMNIMFVSVAERTREIGVRKALGAKRRSILLQFLLEAATICLLGGVLAVALAWPATLVMQQWLPAKLSPAIVALALSVSAITGMIAGYLPAFRAAKLNPVDALRSE